MTRAFKPSPDHPAVDYLVRLHADLGGQIQANKQEAERLAENMRHVEAVIRLYDPSYDMKQIACRRRFKGNPWFKRGTLFRGALDVLRTAGAPMTSRQITERLLAAQGVRDATGKQIRGLAAAVQTALRAKEGHGVGTTGESFPVRWRLAAAAEPRS